ncbi:HepT-like ribonuclease domain-containing protein [Thermoflexus hugenholtzii]
MGPERLYLQDILDACDAIQRFLQRTDETAFMQDELIQSAVLQKLIVIGEAAARLPRSFTEQHPELEWADILAFRNIAVHEYFALDWQIVWVTATEDVPLLRQKIQALLSQLEEGGQL